MEWDSSRSSSGASLDPGRSPCCWDPRSRLRECTRQGQRSASRSRSWSRASNVCRWGADRAITAVRPFEVRRRGRSSGNLLVALAELIVVGGDYLLHLDEVCEEEAGAELRRWATCRPRSRRGQLIDLNFG